MESNFKQGAEVVTVTSGWNGHRYGKPTKIAKVYKNGNFVLESDLDDSRRLGNRPSQYRPDYNGKAASRCGEGSTFHHSWVVQYDEETKGKIDSERAEQAQRVRAANLQGRFKEADFKRLTPHQLTELERLFDMYFPKV